MLGRGKPWSMRGLDARSSAQNCRIAEDVKCYTYCCYIRCATLIVRVGGMPWPQTGATHLHVQQGLSEKGRAIKGIGCLLCSMARICDLWNGSLDQRKMFGSGPLLWSRWLTSSSIATPHSYMQIQYNVKSINLVFLNVLA